MACNSCGGKKCICPKNVPAESTAMASKKRGGTSADCPPHDFYKLSESTVDGKTRRTDHCIRNGCTATHTYYV